MATPRASLRRCISAALLLAAAALLPVASGKRMQLVSSSARADIKRAAAEQDTQAVGAQATGAQAAGSQGAGGEAKAIVSQLSFKQQLRTCNAYTDPTPIGIIQHKRHGGGPDVDLTQGKLLKYKECLDFSVQLGRGDSLEFKQNAQHRGAFLISSLPQRDSILLLVLHRKVGSSLLTFSSHVFQSAPHAQIAVLDMYSGSSKGSIAIQDSQVEQGEGEQAEQKRTEHLAFNEVVALNAGRYDCVLVDSKKQSRVRLDAANAENYVAMRVGSDDTPDFPEEVVVFPALSGAWRCCVPGALALTLMLLLRL